MKRVIAILVSLALITFAIAGCSQQQTNQEQANQQQTKKYPSRPLTVVVEFGAGGATDQVCRALAAEFQESLGVPVNVTNMPGATGGVATGYVMGQPHDGYTILGISDNIRSRAVLDLGTYTYKDFHMWIAAAGVPVLLVKPDSPIQTVDDWINAMKTLGEEFTVANAAIGNAWHIAVALIQKEVGGDYKIVAYGSGREAATAALRGDTKAGVGGLMEVIDLLKAGQLKALASFYDKPIEIEGVGVIPSIAEKLLGLRKYLPFGGWWGYAVPKDVPEEVVEVLDKAYNEAIQSERFKKFLDEQGMIFLGYDRKQSEELAARDTSVVSWLLYDLKLAKKSPEDFGIPKPEE